MRDISGTSNLGPCTSANCSGSNSVAVVSMVVAAANTSLTFKNRRTDKIVCKILNTLHLCAVQCEDKTLINWTKTYVGSSPAKILC